MAIPLSFVRLFSLRDFFGPFLALGLVVRGEDNHLFSVCVQGFPLFPFFTFFVGVAEPWCIQGGIPTFKALDLFHDFGIDPLLLIVVDELPGEGYLGFPACVQGAEDEPPYLGYPHSLVAQP